MSEQRITFKHLGITKGGDDVIQRYHLEATDARSNKIATIAVEPKHLTSARSMKRILLDRCMFYVATRREHDQMLDELFSSSDQKGAEQA